MRRQSELDDIYGVKRIKSNPLEKDNDVPETGFRHSDSYHRYFRGYTEIRVPKENGRFQIQRCYTQPWIVSTASSKICWLRRALLIGLMFSTWGAYIAGMCLPVESNRWWVAAIPGLSSVIALVILSAVAVSCLLAPRKMTLWGYESTSKRLKLLSGITGGCIAATLMAKLAYLFLYGGTAEEIRSCGLVLIAVLAVAVIHIQERCTKYTTVPNDTVLPEGEAHEIW